MVGLLALVALLASGCSLLQPADIGSVQNQLDAIKAPAVIKVGVEVMASGTLVKQPDGSLLICAEQASLADSAPECATAEVRINGLIHGEIPSWNQVGDSQSASGITVRGRWAGDSLDDVEIAHGLQGQEDVPYPENPCPGLQGLTASQHAGEYDAATRKLWQAVASDPVGYGGVWNAGSQGTSIVVVGVAGDPSAARTRLKPDYPFPVCFVRVPRSAAELGAAASAVKAIDPAWITRIQAPVSRVQVYVPYVDEAVWSKLEPLADLLVVSPLVRPVPEAALDANSVRPGTPTIGAQGLW